MLGRWSPEHNSTAPIDRLGSQVWDRTHRGVRMGVTVLFRHVHLCRATQRRMCVVGLKFRTLSVPSRRVRHDNQSLRTRRDSPRQSLSFWCGRRRACLEFVHLKRGLPELRCQTEDRGGRIWGPAQPYLPGWPNLSHPTWAKRSVPQLGASLPRRNGVRSAVSVAFKWAEFTDPGRRCTEKARLNRLPHA